MSLRPVLLALLNREPNSGYGLGRLLQKELSHLWGARLQQIYSELSRLDAEGLVVAETFDLANRPAKKVYTLTAAGLVALDAWLLQESARATTKDELMVRVYALDRMPNAVVRQLEERQRDCENEALALRRKIGETDAGDPGQLAYRLTLEAALSRTDAQATWCGKAITIILDTTEPQRARSGRGLRKRDRGS